MCGLHASGASVLVRRREVSHTRPAKVVPPRGISYAAWPPLSGGCLSGIRGSRRTSAGVPPLTSRQSRDPSR